MEKIADKSFHLDRSGKGIHIYEWRQCSFEIGGYQLCMPINNL